MMPNVSQSVEECRHLLKVVSERTTRLAMALETENSQTFYLAANKSHPITGVRARELIVKDIQTLHYKSNEIPREPQPDQFMAMACARETLEQAEILNQAKTQFKQFHNALRKPFTSEREATEFFRFQVLAALGEKLLNVNAVDRLVPVADAPVTYIRWQYNDSAPTQRTTIKAVMKEIARWMEKCSDDRYEILSSELDRLGCMDPNIPVSRQLRKPIKSLRFRGVANTPGQQKSTIFAGYGRSPLLYLDDGQIPVIKPPSEVLGDAPKKGRGRPKIVSKNRVSPYLDGYYFYKHTKSEEALKASTHV